MDQLNCLNCENRLEEGQNYCPACGQKAAVHRLSFHDVGHDAIHYFTHADRSIFGVLKDLSRDPGKVAREFVKGKRQKYFKPLNFFLIVAGIVVFMTSSFYTLDDSRVRSMEQAVARIQDAAKRAEMKSMIGRMKQVNVITGKYSNVINMVATPLMALFFWIFYRKQYNYVENLVANMYFVSFIMLIYALVVVPVKHVLPATTMYLLGLFFVFEIIYRGYAYYQFSNRKGRIHVIKAYGISLLVTVFWIAITYTLIMYYIRHGF